jgi:hypothetical protein
VGSKIYDFLTESFLFDDSLIEEQFSSVAEDEIRRELKRYREFCLSLAGELEREILSSSSSLKLFSGIRSVDFNLLKQSALYVEQHIIYDPLFELTEEPGSHHQAFNSFLGLKSSSLNKKRLSQVVAFLKSLSPMVAANYVKFLPTSYFFEPPEQIPMRFSATGFADVLPEKLLGYFHENAVVETLKREGSALTNNGSFDIGRIINIRFKNHRLEDTRGYVLAQQQVLSVDEKNRQVKSFVNLPDTPPDEDKFRRWVFQSINQTAGHLYRRVLLENSFAVRFNASYLTRSPFLFSLLELIVPTETSIQTNTINTILNMKLPFLEEVDTETLMKVRTEEGEAFENFRRELDRQLKDLRLVKDPAELKIKAENAMHELSEVQAPQINAKIMYLKKKVFAEAAVLAAGLCGAIQSGGLTLPVALLAAFQGYKSLAEYQKEKRENPAFFLWSVLRNSR